MAGQGVAGRDIVHVRAHIRYAGTDTALVVPAFTLGSAGESSGPPARRRSPVQTRDRRKKRSLLAKRCAPHCTRALRWRK